MGLADTTDVDFTKRVGVVGKVLTSLFFMVFLAMGLFFLGLIARDVWRDVQTRTWIRTQCQILSSQVRREQKANHRYVWNVRYAYEAGGAKREGTVYCRKYAGSDDYGEAQQLTVRYPVEAMATCYVNPAKPTEAVLGHEAMWIGLFAAIPLVFVAIGAWGIYYTWRPPQVKARSLPMSAGTGGQLKGRGLSSLFAIFLLVGGGLLIVMVVVPTVRILSARSWPEVPCKILFSEVSTHGSGEDTTYTLDILYQYTINGRQYQSNRHQFQGGSTSGLARKQRIVNRYKPGTQAVCYVNPADPMEAVLNRGFTADMLFGLIPLALAAAGGGGLVYQARQSREKIVGVDSRNWLPAVKGRPVAVSGAAKGTVPIILRPATGPGLKLLGAILVAAFWNGIVSVFLVEMIGGWMRGKPDMCLTVFLIPFEVVGIAMLGAVVYYVLAFFNPRLTMVVNRASVRLGEAVTVAWQISGRHERVVRLRMNLVGREEATYQRGTTTSTDKSVFARIPIVDTTQAKEIQQGKAIAQIPRDTMHSFEAKNNKIVWMIVAEGEIPRWPDIGEEYRIVVLPAEASEEARP